MGLTSEQVHWLYGAALAAMALAMLFHVRGLIAGRWPEFLIGGALLAVGLALVLDPFLHGDAAPANYAAETAQHLVLGLVLMAASALELYRARKDLRGRLWRLPLALALIFAGLTFLLHAQHDSPAPMLLLVTQHRIIAATLLVLVAAILLAPPGRARDQGIAAPLLTLLLGLELLIYSEGDSLLGVPPAAHELSSPHR